MFGKAGLGGLMKQAQQMQENMKKMQDQLAQTEVEGESGAGLVKIRISCNHQVKNVKIDPSVFTGEKDDLEMLEDLVAAALNDASRRAELLSQEKMESITGGLPLPPGLKLPF